MKKWWTKGGDSIDTTLLSIPVDARCRSCGYALRDLPDPRCPECGRQFDPDDPHSMKLPQAPRSLLAIILLPLKIAFRALRTPLFQVMLLVCISTVLAVSWQLRPSPQAGAFSMYGFGILILLSISMISDLPKEGRSRAVATWTARTLLLVVMISSIGAERCPHARYVWIGPFVFTVDGQRCGNPRRPHTIVTYLCSPYVTTTGW